jgi:hypothetical protein
MSKIFLKVFLLLLVALSLQAKNGLSQKHLLSLSLDKTIEVAFDLPIIETSLKRSTVILKNLNSGQNIQGVLSLKDEKTLLFTSKESLIEAKYSLKIKPLKLQSDSQENHTGFKKYLHKFFSIFHDASIIKTKMIKHTFSMQNDKAKIVEITFNQAIIEVQEGNTTSIAINAIYDDNSTKDISQDVEWIVGDTSIMTMQSNTLRAVQEGKTTLQALYETIKSIKLQVDVYKEVNGYKLPLEPDETLNNSTLLGIDSNNNGVRDDVERWIFLEMKIYNGYEKIEQVIAMQEAKANQLSLVDPTNRDYKVQIAMNAAHDCWNWYDYSKQSHVFGSHGKFSRAIKDKSFNTKERLKTYWQYDGTLAGRVFTSTPTLQTQSQCEVSIDDL